MDLGLHGRVAIVTGASRGIGFAVARALGAEGASVVVAARDPALVDHAVATLVAAGIVAVGAAVDVADPDSSAQLTELALGRFGRVDVVVNNAGGGGNRPLPDFDEDEWIDVYRVNVVSAVRLSLLCIPTMMEHRWGRIVNIASTMARDPDPRFSAYGAAKAALLHATRSLSFEYAKHGILVNCVLPGLTRSNGVLAGYEAVAAATNRTPDDIERRMMERQPIAAGRTGTPEEIAAAVAFLASEQASWITGAMLSVDGGTIRALP